ncbi:hypothetical protein DFH06DRAFT_360559 [Mycena polygramma]|nr:hypothetical protein DFH06DRAFT_360559 [Mycena polygramma]
MLEADRARLADLEAQILHLERSLTALQLEKMLVQERLDSYKYPALTLPVEIVSEIFMHFLPTYPRFPPLTGTLSPVSLTQICHRWREIALATPTLWRAIPLSSTDIPFKTQLLIFDSWFTRSRSCPLSIQLGDADSEDFLGDEAVSAIFAVVAAHYSRLKHMKLFLPLSHLRIIQGGMPLLSHLDIEIMDEPSDSVTDTDTFRQLPRLRSVVLNDHAAAYITLPWAQLTSLVLNSVYLYECLPVLKQTTNLVHCELRLFTGDGSAVDSIITLPRLESLALHDPVNTAVNEYLRFFVVPALRTLEISEKFIGPKPIEMLRSLISASGCTLQDVCITGATTTSRDAYREAFPSIPGFSFIPTSSRTYYDPMGEEDPEDE